MKIAHNQLNDVAASINFEGIRYCALVQVVNDETISTELRWSRGSKEIESTTFNESK